MMAESTHEEKNPKGLVPGGGSRDTPKSDARKPLGAIVNVPGHGTDSIRENPAPKKTITAIVTNMSRVPFNLRGVVVRPGKLAAISPWNILRGDTVARLWLAAKALIVVSEKEIEAQPRLPPLRAKKRRKAH
jgi:hypothetical protein